MNKNIYILSAFVLLVFSLVSCGNDDDDSTAEMLVWKAQQDQVFRNVANSGLYSDLGSKTGDGTLYYRSSTMITDNDAPVTLAGISPRLIEITGERPLFTDSVVVRYMGWYLDEDNEKVVFDGTENMVIDGTTYTFNKMQGIGFLANGVIAGWTDILTSVMYVGDEYEVCIPQQLAYKSSGSGSIKYYTTLFFNIKLLGIYRKESTDDDKTKS